MHTRPSRLAWVMAIACAHGANAQQALRGLVLGFDGKPVAQAIVHVADRSGGRASNEVLTDDDGRFELVEVAGPVRLVVQIEGVCVERAVPIGTSPIVRCVEAPHFVLRGEVRLPNGAPAAGIDVTFRLPSGAVATGITSEAGAFALHAGVNRANLVLDPAGWQLEWPVFADQPLVIRLRDDPAFFALRGRVLGDQGPLVGEIVTAQLQRGAQLRVRTGRDGSYTLWTRAAVEQVAVGGAEPMRRRGPFARADTAVDLDVREHGFVMVEGVVVDAQGVPVEQVLLFDVEREGPPPERQSSLARTGRDGRFVVRVPRGTPFLYAWCDDGDRGKAVAVPRDGAALRVQFAR